MTETRLPDDILMQVLREDGVFICQCPDPQPVFLVQWSDYECGRCGKAIR